MSSQLQSYRAILKATSLFSSIHGGSVLLSLIKTKLITLFIGASGFGVLGLFNASIAMVAEFAKLGLDTSIVKELSLSNEGFRVAYLSSAIEKILRILAFFVIVLVFLFSEVLSHFTFGNQKYVNDFRFLSIVIGLGVLISGKLAILQGANALKVLAKIHVNIAVVGLVIAIPLYYYLRLNGIVIVLLLTAFVSYLICRSAVRKLQIVKVKMSNKTAFKVCKEVIQLGVAFCVSGGLSILAMYIIRVGIGNYGSLVEVGYYTAGFVVLESYFGLVFKAMQTDYFPRISRLSKNIKELNQVVSFQTEIGVLIIAPIIVLCLIFVEFFIKLLFTSEFLVLVPFFKWALLGLFVRTISWTLGFNILAQGDKKVYLINSFIFNPLFVLMSLLGFYYYNLEGVGLAYLVYYIIHLLIVGLIVNTRYGVLLSKQVVKSIVLFTIVLITVAIINQNPFYADNYIIFTLFVLSLSWSLYRIAKGVHFKSLIKRFKSGK